MSATEPITVTISHSLGRDGAKQRIDGGLDKIRAEILRHVKTLDYAWDGYTLNFTVRALMQTITARLEVYDDSVRIELGLPRLLHLMGKQIAGRIESQASKLLVSPKGG